MSELASEMQQRSAEGDRNAAYETHKSGNSAGYWPRIFEFQEKLANEWAEKTYLLHRETRELQGCAVTPAFIREVRDHAIAEVLAARKSSVIGQFSLWHMRTGEHPNAIQARNWCMRMDRLSARWRSRLEAEAAAAEYDPQRPADPYRLTKSDSYKPSPSTWEEFYQALKALSDEEVEVALRNRRDCLLRAHVDYSDPNFKYGECQLAGGISETFKARFEVLAMSAARAVGANNLDGPPLNVWLFHVFQNLRKGKTDLLFAPSDTGAIISRVCEASALYCLRLQANELEKGQPAVVMTNSTKEQKKKDGGTQPRRFGPKPLRPSGFVVFAGSLWVQSKGKSGKVNDLALLELAARLDGEGFLPPTKFLESRCANELKRYNSKNANSKKGPTVTWTRLVQTGDKDLLRGMRRMLSRCAPKPK